MILGIDSPKEKKEKKKGWGKKVSYRCRNIKNRTKFDVGLRKNRKKFTGHTEPVKPSDNNDFFSPGFKRPFVDK